MKQTGSTTRSAPYNPQAMTNDASGMMPEAFQTVDKLRDKQISPQTARCPRFLAFTAMLKKRMAQDEFCRNFLLFSAIWPVRKLKGTS